MTPCDLITFLQKAIDAGKGYYPIIITRPDDGHELKIVNAVFLEHGVDTYEATSENLVLTTKYYY